jgi:hypothetical protein
MKGQILKVACAAILLMACAQLTAPVQEAELIAEAEVNSSAAAAKDAATDDSSVAVADAGGVIEGIVWQSGTRVGLAKATVSIREQFGGVALTTTTDASGKFRIAGLRGGKHVVVISHKRHLNKVTPMITLPTTGTLHLSAWLALQPKPEPATTGGYCCSFRPPPLLLVDGQTIVTRFGTHDISAHEISALTLLSEAEALQAYGRDGAYGSVTAETRR